jgi:RNA polymerase sigma factor (sigma-70 family)
LSDSLHNEAELLREITEGNEQAFTAVYQHYHQVLYAYAFRYLKSEFWAEEVVQEIFAYLWTEKNNLSAIQNLGGWLRRLVWNKSVDRIRRQKAAVKAQYALQAFLQQNTEATNLPNERLFTLLESAVNNLPPQRRIIYELKYKQKLSLDQIADKL